MDDPTFALNTISSIIHVDNFYNYVSLCYLGMVLVRNIVFDDISIVQAKMLQTGHHKTLL